MNRIQFQELAKSRIKEAAILLDSKLHSWVNLNLRDMAKEFSTALLDPKLELWDGAHYLAGYAVECGLKACILKRLEQTPGLFFMDREFVKECWTHDLKKLVKHADLLADLDMKIKADKQFESAWSEICQWSEVYRYRSGIPESTARALFWAITHKDYGVLTWIATKW